jgi:hypothetical protein
MIDDKGRIQTGTPAHRLLVLVTDSGAIVRPHAGDVLDTCAECESRGNADERTAALFEQASAKIEVAEGRPGIAYAAKADDIRHLLARTTAAPGSFNEPEEQVADNPGPTKGKKKKKGTGPDPDDAGGPAAGE